MFLIFIFILGLIMGSFLNVVICRLKTKESVFFTRSNCPKCGAVLEWYDLIPVISFILTLGKCRYCRKKISWQYPMVEIITGLLFLQIFNEFLIFNNFSIFQFFNFNNLLVTGYWLLITCLLIIIFVYDLKHYIIPDKIVYPAIIIAFLYRLLAFDFASLRSGNNLLPELVEGYKLFIPYLLSAFIPAAFFLCLILISKGKWMGMGDVKLAFLMGLVLGWPGILIALLLSFFSGAIIGVCLILFGKKRLKSQIPFGPFLSGATIFVMLFNVDNFLLFL